MPILTQFLRTFLIFYWSQLTDFFSECLFAGLQERCHCHLLVKLAECLDFRPIEAVCAPYHHQIGPGAPASYPVSVLVRCLLVGYLYCLSLRELEQRLYTDMLVRWFVGLSVFGEVPDHSTLERFEQWVRDHHPRIFHDTVLKQIDEKFPQSRQFNQVGDTYAMLANAAEEDLVPRLRHTVRCLLEAARQSMPELLSPTVSDVAWHALFGPPKEPLVFFLDEQQRRQRIETVALAAQDLHRRFTIVLQACPSQSHPEVRLWLGYLGKILHDEVVILPEAGSDGWRVRRRTPKEQRSDPETCLRIGSATDPEATYRVHGPDEDDIRFGYNVQLAASTDGFIRETQAYTGALSDQAGVAPLVAEQIEHLGSCPPKLIYDMAAGSGKIRADVEQASAGKTQLVAQQLPYEKRSPRFGPYDFTLAEDRQVLTCPNGQTSRVAYPSQSGEGRNFRFYAFQCWQGVVPRRMKSADLACRCPLWEQCRDSRQGPGSMRQVFISDYREHVLEAEAYNQTETFKQEMKQRPLIERVVFELTNYCGARRCRRRGLLAADFQAKMCATVYNLKLWVRKLSRMAPRRAAPALAG
jgi:hypothetical protein